MEGVPLDQLDPRPYYVQLAAIIRDQIVSGELPPRAQLPSEAAMEAEHGVSRGTVRRALEVLQAEKWVVTIQGRGTFVVEKPPVS